MNAARSSRRYTPVWVTWLLIILAVVVAVIAAIYFSDTAGKLPSFFPGHLAHSAHKHTKHGIAAAALAVLLLIAAWMSAGRRRTA